MIKSSGNQGFIRSRRLVLGVLLGLFLVAAPFQKANAQCDTCVTSTIDFGLIPSIDADFAALDSILIAGLVDIHLALYGDGVTGVDTDMVNGFNTLIQAQNSEAGDTLPMVAQMNSDSKKYYGDIQGAADMAPDGLVNDKSTHCALTYTHQMEGQLEAFAHAMATASVRIVRDRNSNVGATAGVNRKAEDACERAPFVDGTTTMSTTVAGVLSGCPQKDSGSSVPATLIDADYDMASVFDKLQYAVPQTLKVQPDGHVSFTPQSDDEWYYVAAWRFCEHQVADSVNPPPATTGTVGVGAISRATTGIHGTMVKLPVIQSCMQAIAERTSCSQAAGSTFVITTGSIQANCFQIQNIACHRLIDQPPSGLGITSVGREDVDYALQNCDTDGLSLAMFKYAWKHGCAADNYAANTIPNESSSAGATAETTGTSCGHDQGDYDNFVNYETQEFVAAKELADLE